MTIATVSMLSAGDKDQIPIQGI